MDKPRHAMLALLAAAACGIPLVLHAGGKAPLAAFVVLGQTPTGEQVALARVVIDQANAVGFGLSEFGYMDIVLKGGGDWTGRLLNRKGKLLVECESSHWFKTRACKPAGT